MLADWFVLSWEIKPPPTWIVDEHDPDIAAFEQLNLIATDRFATGGNARNRDFRDGHFRSLEL